MRRACHALAAALLSAVALISADCTLDTFCQDGTPGCAADSCKDLVRDGDETDVDCGGSCGPCAEDAACMVDHDCTPGRCLDGSCCGPPCVAWARRDGSTGDDLAWSTAVMADGTVVVAGDFHGTVDFGSGPITSNGAADVFVAALAPGGGLRWVRHFGGDGDEMFPHLAVASDGHIFVGGAFQSAMLDTGAGVLHQMMQGATSLFVLSLSASGQTLAARELPGTMNTTGIGGFKTIAATADGGFLSTGQLGSFDFGGGRVLSSPNGDFDIFIAKFGPDLGTVWAFGIGDAGDDWVRGATLDAAGDLIMTATSTSNTNYGGPPVAQPGLVLAKYAGATGAHVWSRSYGANLTSFGVAAGAQGAISLVGDLTGAANFGTGKLIPKGETDGFVALFDPAGNPTWVTQVSSTSEIYGLAVAPDDMGGTLAALRLTGTLRFVAGSVDGPTGVDSVLLLRLDAGGHLDWARNAGGVVLDHTAILLSPGPSGRLLLHGGFAGELDLGGTLKGAGQSDAFVAELLP